MAAATFRKTVLLIEGIDCFLDETEADLKKPTKLHDLLDGDNQVVVGVYELVRVYDINQKPVAALRG